MLIIFVLGHGQVMKVLLRQRLLAVRLLPERHARRGCRRFTGSPCRRSLLLGTAKVRERELPKFDAASRRAVGMLNKPYYPMRETNEGMRMPGGGGERRQLPVISAINGHACTEDR